MSKETYVGYGSYKENENGGYFLIRLDKSAVEQLAETDDKGKISLFMSERTDEKTGETFWSINVPANQQKKATPEHKYQRPPAGRPASAPRPSSSKPSGKKSVWSKK